MKNNSGQIMLLTVSLIGFSVLTAVSIFGYVFMQKIRMATIFIDATKAIYAADAGIECELYNLIKGGGENCNNLSFTDTKTRVKVARDSNQIKSVGSSNNANRAFSVTW